MNGNLETDCAFSILHSLFSTSYFPIGTARATLLMIPGSTEPRRQMKTPDRGFTLIEMIVVMAIIAILALMLVPTYQDKIVRDQIIRQRPV